MCILNHPLKLTSNFDNVSKSDGVLLTAKAAAVSYELCWYNGGLGEQVK